MGSDQNGGIDLSHVEGWSIVLTVFAIGLSTRPQDVAYVIRRPGLLLKSLLSINVVMPVFAASVIAVTHLDSLSFRSR